MNWLRYVTDPKKDENNQKDYAKDYVKDYEEMKLHLALNPSKEENMSRISPCELVIASPRCQDHRTCNEYKRFKLVLTSIARALHLANGGQIICLIIG